MSEGYECPVLAVSEIVTFLQGETIDISENDILRPDPRKWHQNFGKLFELHTRRPIEQATQAVCRTLQFQAEHPELHEEGFAQMAFTLCMQRVFYNCGFEGFSIEDVITPTKSRLVKMMSAYFNFFIHIQTRREVFDEEKQCLDRFREKYDAVKSRQKELKIRTERMEESREQRDREKQQYQDECDECSQGVIELKSQQEAQMKHFNEIKLLLSEKLKEKESIKQRIAEIHENVEQLSQKIVHSPERLKQEQDRLLKRLSDMKDELSRKEQILIDNRRLLERTNVKKMSVEKALKLSMDVQEAMENDIKIDAELHKLAERRNDLADKSNHLYKSGEDLSEKTNVRKEQKRNILVQTGANKQEKHHKLTEFKQYKTKMIKTNQNIKSEIEDIENACKILELQAKDNVQQVEKSKQLWQKEFSNYMNEMTEITKQAGETLMHCTTILKNQR